MVEGPKVSLKSERLQILVGQTCLYVANEPRCNSCRVSRVIPVGKELFVVLASSDGSETHVLRLHFGMDGSERIMRTLVDADHAQFNYAATAAGMMPQPSRKRFSGCLVFEEKTLLLFDSSISTKTPKYLETAEGRLERDVMHDGFNVESAVDMLRCDSRSIEDAVMDQINLPGVGNIIKCEGLFQSRVHPHAVSKNLSNKALRSLVAHLRDYARYWYGCTKSNRANAKAIYGQQQCTVCAVTVTLVRSGQMQRITYFCGQCQSTSNQSDTVSTIVHPQRFNESWTCSDCSFSNVGWSRSCEICGVTRQIVPGEESVSIDSGGGGESSCPQADALAFLTAPLCAHHDDCTLSRVRKEGPNSARLFFSCARGGKAKCPFFQWADDQFPRCLHGSPTTVRRVLKPGLTNGKFFFCCTHPKSTQCNFFMFVDAFCPPAVVTKKRSAPFVDDGLSRRKSISIPL